VKALRKVWHCSVRCPQRIQVRPRYRSPLATADATTVANVLTRGLEATRCSVRCPQRIGCDRGMRAFAILSAVDDHDLTGVRPIVRVQDQATSNGILANIIPFLAVRFIGSQHMIVKSRLPKRMQLLAPDAGWARTFPEQSNVQPPLQSFNPSAECQRAPDSEAHKQVNMIRHDDIAANADVMSRGASSVFQEETMDSFGREDGSPQMRIKRYEVQRRIVFLKDTVEPRRFSFARGEHSRRCNARCHHRTSLRSGDPLATADATTIVNVLTPGLQTTRCRVHCHQRIEARPRYLNPLATADATTIAHVPTPGLQTTRCRVRLHQRILVEPVI
jgi:hypothetical protein